MAKATRGECSFHEENKDGPIPKISRDYLQRAEKQIRARRTESILLHVESFKIADKARGVDPADKEEQEKLTAELRRLEEQSEKADGETAILEAAVQEHWNAFASFKCRELMRRVELLPRELRIMVFEALWENSYHMISEWNLQPLKTKCDGPIELLESWSSRGMQHCLKERFMGPNMLSEITEAWWRTSIFEIKALHLVPYFLSEAFWGGSVKDRVRHVVIPFKYRRRPSPGHSPAQITGGAKCECLNNELDHLMHFSTCTQIEFRYKVAEIREPRFTVGWRQDEFLRAVSRIYPGLEKLKQKGYLMVAVIDGDITISMKDTEIASEAWRQTINDQVGAFDNVYYEAQSHVEYTRRCWPLEPKTLEDGPSN